MTRRILSAVLLAIATVGPALAAEDAFPNRPLRIITGYLPGGVSDTIARVVGEKLGEKLGQRVVIDGRPGAGGMLSMDLAAKATPDGYSLFLAQPVVSIAAVMGRIPRDPVTVFAPVIQIGFSPTLLVANAALPVNNAQDLIALAKAKPGTLNYASSGHAGPNHIAGELFASMAGIKLVHVPYKGAGVALPAVIGGEVQLNFGPLLPAIPHVKGGRIKAIGVTSEKRSRAVPDIPSLGETVRGYHHVSWFGLVAPAKTPRPILERLNAEMLRVMEMPEVRERLIAQGVDTESGTREQFGRLMTEDVGSLAKVFRDAGIRIE